MSEGNADGGVRRFGRKDRKRSLERRDPLFPVDQAGSELGQDEAPATPPITELNEPPAEADELDEAEKLLREAEPPIILTAAKPSRPLPTRKTGHRGGCLPNLVALVFVLATIGVVGLFATITANPYSPLNPFPPFTPIPIVITATFLPPTATPEPTAAPTATFTPLPVEAINSGGDTSTFAFRLVGEGAIYAPNANDQACNWSSIAGTVTDATGAALNGYRIHITGNGLNDTVFSGSALTFGQGGFELFLNGTPQENTYSVQLENAEGIAASPVYSITTQAACDKNVAILNFVSQ